MKHQTLLVVDCNVPFTQHIANTVRDMGVYCEVKAGIPSDLSSYIGVILCGTNEASSYSVPVMCVPVATETTGLKNFLFDTCEARGDWKMADVGRAAVAEMCATVGSGRVLCALSGGVDSSVTAALAYEAFGDRLTCIFVDTGLMRKDEGDQVSEIFGKRFGASFLRVNAQDRFLDKLAGVTEPEKKRKIIGEEFIRVFEEEAKKLGEVEYLAQGTIYPDVIESGATEDNTNIVKSHHNVGGLPEIMDFRGILEPLRLLFKGEVRRLGLALGLPSELVNRQPFPGPGLAVRCLGEINHEKLDVLREADLIFRQELESAQIEASQYFAVLLDTHSVGVVGASRTYRRTVALRAVQTTDFMSADWVRLLPEFLAKVSNRITSEVSAVGRVVYDITGKPPATIEWE